MRLERSGLVVWAVLTCSLGNVARSSPSTAPIVERVKQADEEGRYADVLRDVEATKTLQLTVDDRVTLLQLEASAHAAFGDEAAAVLAFRRLLALQPGFVQPADVSPKLRRYLDAAREAGPITDSNVAIPPPHRAPLRTEPQVGGLRTDVAPRTSRAWYRSGWVWGAASVVAAGTVAILIWRGTHDSTSPNLGEIPLP